MQKTVGQMSSNLWEEDGEAPQGRCRNVLYLPWMAVLWLGPLSKRLQAVHEHHVFRCLSAVLLKELPKYVSKKKLTNSIKVSKKQSSSWKKRCGAF